MKKETKQFERQFIRVRDSLERKAVKIVNAAIKEQYKYVLSKLSQTDFRQWPKLVDSIPEDPIKIALEKIYVMSSPLAVMVRSNMLIKKATDEEVIMTSVFQRQMANLVSNAGDKITTITSTSKSKILNIIRDVLDLGETEGLGIPEITRNLYKEVGANLRGNGFARAKAIAQTEMISASNQASEVAAKSTGYEYRKFWSTSGLPNIRPSHIDAEQFSDTVDGLKPDEKFPNGLLYPGDPNGTAEEIINCRCTILHEII